VVNAGPLATSEILEAIRTTTPVDNPRRDVSRRQSLAPRQRSSSTQRSDRHVRFDDRRRTYDRPTSSYNRAPQPGPRRATSGSRPQFGQQGASYRRPAAPPQGLLTCTNCGRAHQPGHCPASGKLCRSCGKRNHFAVCCRSRQRSE